MKTILCYGDSNTWGYNAITEARYPHDQRWVTLLGRELGPGYLVIPEGLNGRTTVWPDPVEGEHKNGKSTLIPILESHHPLDLVVLMLGTNDLKHRYGLSAWDIARSAQTLVEMIRNSTFGQDGGAPQVLLVAPPPTCVAGTRFEEMFAGSDEKSQRLAHHYRLVSEEAGCSFLDAGRQIVSSKVDGIHLDSGELPKLAAAVGASVRELLG
jgi:lysophospholipase L1-like esterase